MNGLYFAMLENQKAEAAALKFRITNNSYKYLRQVCTSIVEIEEA